MNTPNYVTELMHLNTCKISLRNRSANKCRRVNFLSSMCIKLKVIVLCRLIYPGLHIHATKERRLHHDFTGQTKEGSRSL